MVLRVRQQFETPYRSVDPYDRVTYSLALQFVQFGVLSECGLTCGHGPEMMRARWLDLTWVMHFLMIFITQMHSLARHSFLIFVVFHHSLQQLLVCLGFPLSCPLRSSLFHASLRRAARRRWCSLTHGFRLRLKEGTTWMSLCGINHQRRTVRVKPDFPVHST